MASEASMIDIPIDAGSYYNMQLQLVDPAPLRLRRG